MYYGQKHWCTCTLNVMVATALCVSIAGARADSPTNEGVTRVLTKARVLTQSFQVQCAGVHCNVVTYRNPRAVVNDIKIDAILTAKAIRDVYPSIQSVTVQFYEANLLQYQFIEVHASDVGLFARGGVSKEQLLSSLPVHASAGGSTGGISATAVPRQVVDNYQVVPGYNQSNRTRMLADLHDIQARGGDLSALWPRFKAMEKVIKDGGAEATTNDYNQLVPDVAQSLKNATLKSSRIEEQSRLRNNQIESQGKVGQILPSLHSGFGLLRRQRLAREIDRKALLGDNVQYFQSILVNTIEPLCRSGEEIKASEQMADLERQIGLSPYMGR